MPLPEVCTAIEEKKKKLSIRYTTTHGWWPILRLLIKVPGFQLVTISSVWRRVQREITRSQNHLYKSSSHRSGGHRPHGAPIRPPLRSSGHRPHGGSMRPSHGSASHRPHGPSMNPRRPTMNVDASTNSTNLSGTKDAANQKVKKDKSSLRYIVLPNRAHDALLESTSSKPYEESNTQVPEGSGNPNPTASSSNPPANQMDTLTVESPIPTVSSPVPTACLNDSLESSNETIGVEADVSNMETSISASPTPTLRIHKDHPKSQIISPVDTPIQTRHKSKMVEEQSFIATIHQKTNPALLQCCLFSCLLSQVEPKKVFDALQDPS
nr:hypothetical protein [Tanacetum cinerariifolium]